MIAICLKHIIKNKIYLLLSFLRMVNGKHTFVILVLNNEAFRSFLYANGIQYGISRTAEGAFHITTPPAFSTLVLNMK